MGHPESSAVPTPPPTTTRLASIDAYRGLVMLLMLMGTSLHLDNLVLKNKKLTGPVWEFIGTQQSHVEWRGCNLHDLIQPSFMFLVGVALPFSLASRAAKGASFIKLFAHAVWRSMILVALAIVLSSSQKSGTNWIFTNVLAQIGLGYPILFLFGFASQKVRWVAIGIILVGYWAFFALAPLPGESFNPAEHGVKPEWQAQNWLEGFSAHWNKNANPAAEFDWWFLNQFPRRDGTYKFNPGGYATLNFVPSLATMLLGLIAGAWLRLPESAGRKIGRMIVVGLIFLGSGYALDWLGICPSVKVIWTPAWVLFSGGWCFLFLAGFFALLDTGGPKWWAFPLTVIGMNSIVAYCLPTFLAPLLSERLDIHLGKEFFTQLFDEIAQLFNQYFGYYPAFDPGYAPLARGCVILALFWLLLFWMSRRKIFLRI
jgi:heparan-alpha-glucosaminide N-acetyltransferase